MEELSALPVNLVDIGVLLVLLVSAVLAYARGFVHEVLSVGGWIGAIFATFYGFTYFSPLGRRLIPIDNTIADFATGTVIFILTLVFLSLLTRAIAKRVQASALNVLDRSLGFLFGLARGAVLVCVAYLVFDLMVAEEDHPVVIKESRSIQLIKPGAALLKSLVPDHINARSLNPSSSGNEIDVNKLLSPTPKDDAKPVDGYDNEQTRSLDRAIDAVVPNN